jgi:LPS-assembly lipoprotein
VKGERYKGGVRLNLILSLAFVLLFSGCGFHLRGTVMLPQSMSNTAIVGADGSELYYEVENALRNAGGKVAQSVDATTSVLVIDSQQINRRVLSVDSQGRDAEYELVFKLVFSLRDPAGQVIADKDKVTVSRDFSFDPDNVLAKSEEEVSLRREMLRQAVQQMMRRLSALARQPAAQE